MTMAIAFGGTADESTELGACNACGTGLFARVVCFARCHGCGAENYRPCSERTLEERVTAFWRRATSPVTQRDRGSSWITARGSDPREATRGNCAG